MDKKIALVTGASRGIGQGIALRLAADGYHVLVNHPSSRDSADETLALIAAAGGSAEAIEADISKVSAVDAMFTSIEEKFGRCDVLVNNAGVSTFETLWEITEDVWDKIHSVNLKGAFFCSQKAARLMVDRKEGGRIVSISSISAHHGGITEIAYCPTKSGIRSLMQAMCLELAPHGITCNSVSPGTTQTPMLDYQASLEGPGFVDAFVSRVPTGRLARTDEIAAAVAFLASPEASYINGSEIVVDGGLLANPH